MAKFDQRGQKVNNQVNAENINSSNLIFGDNNLIFGEVQNKADFATELRKFLEELDKVSETGTINKNIVVDVEMHIKKAAIEADEPQPKKQTILDHIETAKTLLQSVVSATGLVNVLIQAAKVARTLFL